MKHIYAKTSVAMALLGCLLASCATHTPAGSARGSWPKKVFAPYAYIPRNNTSMMPAFSITNCYAEIGQKYYTLAFIISDRNGVPSWAGNTNLHVGSHYYADQIKAVRDGGGDVLISFGGAAGSEIAFVTTNEVTLQQQYQSVIDEYHLTWMDFDIEGRSMTNLVANRRRNLVLKNLQQKNPHLRISFTLGVNPTGMGTNSMGLLNDAHRQGVKIESVNVMTMYFGSRFNVGTNLGDLCILSANAAHKQVVGIDPAIKIGITPLIGTNSSSHETFNLEDAKTILDFARKTDWVESIGFWQTVRDRAPAASGAPRGGGERSGIDQKDWDFSKILKPLSL
jgi:Glycosyl hydrolases family 18